MKVCIVSMSTIKHSGIGRMVLNVAEEFQKKGHTVGFITEHGGDYHGVLMNVQFRSRNPIIFLKNTWNIFSFINKYDVVLCFDVLPTGFISCLASNILRKPFYLHCVGTYSLFDISSRIKNYFIRLVYKNATEIFVLSKAVKKHIENSIKDFNLDKAIIVPPGVQVDFFHHTNEKSNFVEEPYFITVGEIKGRKGYDFSIQAFGEIAEQYPNLKYVCVGQFDSSNKYTVYLKSIIKKYNLQERVLFLENIDDIELRKLYSHAKFFIMTSRTTPEFIEGFGIVYLESALCGLASIGACDTGAEDAIIDKCTGLLVHADIDSIKFGMKKLLDDDAYTTNLAKAAEKNAFGFSWERVVGTYLAHMDKIEPQ